MLLLKYKEHLSEVNTGLSYGVADELTLSAMTLRHTRLADRLQAAGIAGFQGFGWRLEDFDVPHGHELGEFRLIQLAQSSGLKATEAEYLRHWVGREHEKQFQAQEHHLFQLARRLETRRLNVAIFESHPHEQIMEALAALCRRAAPYHLIVQLEFMPYEPSVPTLADAWQIVHEVRRPNLGLLIDAWHWGRSHDPAAALAHIPAHYITGIQLSDDQAHAMPDLTTESRHHRLIPGTGSVNLPAFLLAMSAHGVKAPLSVEVMSDRLDAMPAIQAASELAHGTRSVLWRAHIKQ
jgi:sugar phosphate isomerase/epimerase